MASQDEEAREREVKQIEVERYAKELELAAREAEEEKQRRHEAYLRCVPGLLFGACSPIHDPRVSMEL